MKLGHEDELRLAERAAQWFGALKEDATAGTAFFNWLAESPRHVDAFLSTLVLAQELAELTPESQERITRMANDASESDVLPANVLPLAPRSATRTNPIGRTDQPRRWRLGAGIAAGITLVVATWLALNVSGRQTYTTAVGEQRVIELVDGSIVYLNTHSRVEVRYTDESRSLRLLDGQAFFKVAHDTSRPFIVQSDGMKIQAIGTQFDVYRRASGTRVAVLEGLVQISRNNASQPAGTPADGSLGRLAAGEAADIATSGKITRREPVDAAKTTAWRQRRLVFRENTLSEIAAEFNRYNATLQIRVVGETANAGHFSGNFEADAPETLAQALAADDTLVIDRTGREIVIRAR